jgi:type IV pilus assembly protein PilV
MIRPPIVVDRQKLRLRQGRGFSMIEVLVTLLIVTFGLLGVAGLLLNGLKANQTSNIRTTAQFQAYEIADRMRANMKGVFGHNYDTAPGGVPSKDCETDTCNPSEQAQFDLYQWEERNKKLLPPLSAGGKGTVTRINADLYEITVRWSEDKSLTLGKSFTLRFEP